jgi:hypothetical protein
MEASDGAGKTSQESPSAKDSLPLPVAEAISQAAKRAGVEIEIRLEFIATMHRQQVAQHIYYHFTTTNFDPFRRFAPSSRPLLRLRVVSLIRSDSWTDNCLVTPTKQTRRLWFTFWVLIVAIAAWFWDWQPRALVKPISPQSATHAK